MSLLSDRDKNQLKNLFEKEMINPVNIIYFTQEEGSVTPGMAKCLYCRETEQIIKEVSSLTNMLNVTTYDFTQNVSEVNQYEIDKIPAMIIKNENDLGLRFYGIPSGYEFSAFIETIVMVSRGTTGLKENTKSKLIEYFKNNKQNILIQVFVTPTCPYCTRMVTMGYQFAMEFANIKTEVIEATEFPYLADKYSVFGVPKTIINETIEIDGAVSEEIFLEHILKVKR